ncbi:MAG: outer membrane protein assembly factor [Hyphomonadaceae bacterium]|nr:outer membrane protein assembly factor [Hyphomonadaceae bacterium]
MRVLPVLPAAIFAGLGVAVPILPAWADSPVVIEGPERETRQAILDLLPDRERPTTLFEAERIAEEAAGRAMAWLRSEGYYAATVTPEASEEPAVARLVIAPGPRFRFAAPALTFVDAQPAQAAAGAAGAALTPVEAGAPARAEAVLAAEAGAVQALQQAGYPDAAAADRRVVVDHATALVSPEFRVNAGGYARLGQVRAEPDTLFRASFIEDLRNWEIGAPYTPEALTRLRRDMTSTGAVSLASTRLAPPNAEGVRDVVLVVEPARRNAYELGAGYSTTEGLGVEAEWTRRNFTRRADALTLSTRLGQLQQSFNAELSRPHAPELGHTLSIGATLAREDLEPYTRQGAELYAAVEAAPRLELGRSYGVRLTADTYDNTSGDISNAYVASAFLALRRDTTDIRLDPRAGSILDARIEPAFATGSETVTFARFTGGGRIYHSFGEDDRLTLAARAQAGWMEAISGNVENAPPDRRFYTGGGGSVRGYDYNSIYPRERDALGLNPGGQGMLETSVEARWRFADHWGAAAFIDGGNAFDSWSDAADLRWGAGVGVRYNLGFAPLRVDIAFPLHEDATNDYALYISLGQAF